MRLQLSIHRHTLPPTHILFSTAGHLGSHTVSRVSTISDLLLDVNDLVPLESEDGEWGLEDYIVEVAATADQDEVYEALHYHIIENVLREDDEVIIRYLKSDELRGRRSGGRLQITGDGRHLVDGVVWGKRWVAGTGAGRPGVGIPPRKRRRVLVNEGEDESLPLLGVTEGLEDGKYIDDGNEGENEVKLLGSFDDADEEDSDGDDDEEMDVEEGEIQLLLKDAEEIEHVDMDESEDVLERQLRSRTRLGKRKRVAEVEMEDKIEDDIEEEADFEGFSTPAKSLERRQVQFEDEQSDGDSDSDTDADSMMAKTTVQQAKKIQDNLIDDAVEDNSSEFERDSESEASSSESELDEKALPAAVNAVSTSHTDVEIESDDEDETSSSGSSESDSEESDASVSSSESESESDSDDDDASSSSGSSSESATSPDSESESDTDNKKPVNQTAKTAMSPTAKQATSLIEKVVKKATVPPGSGTTRTLKKNERKRKVTQLNRLKELGHLPDYANFKDLEAYQANIAPTQAQPVDDEQQLEAARAQMLAAVQAADAVQEIVNTYETAPIVGNTQSSVPVEPTQPAVKDGSSKAKLPTKPSQPSSQPVTDSSSPRNRLDVAATRRLLFGSLGVRNPKTKAEEEALREKLAKPTRQQQQLNRSNERSNSPPPEAANGSNTDGSWKEKLIISAVECEKDGAKMDPPPFPFEQYWMRNKKSRRMSDDIELDYGEAPPSKGVQVPDMMIEEVQDTTQRGKLQRLSSGLPNFSVRECFEALQRTDWVYDDALDLLWGAEASQGPGGSIQVQTQESRIVFEQVSNNGSRTVSFDKDETDGMPIPTDFEALADLDKTQILPGAIIAYKELHFGPETNFQPEISSYRVAKVDEVDDEGHVILTLSVRDRKQHSQRNPETGELIVNNFQIRTSEDDEVDDGTRDIQLTDMMQPKLVEASSQLLDANAVPTLRGGEVASEGRNNSSEVIPDSVPAIQNKDTLPEADVEMERIEIDTPLRKEITTMVKDAGFDSAMDEHLLEPFPEKDYELPPSSQPSVEEDISMADADDEVVIGETSQTKTTVRSSSPLFPPHESVPAPVDAESFPLSDNPQPTSSPPVSPQLTVEYPHISQMELDSSFHAPGESSKNSSSHQDAQRVPVVPTADLTLTTAEDEELFPAADESNVLLDDESVDNLGAEVPQSASQSQEPSNVQSLSELDDDTMTPRRSSFLGGRGFDGPGSTPDSRPWNDEDDPYSSDNFHSDKRSESEDSLPSLAELTSSQRRKINSKKIVLKYASSASKKISPPPTLKKPKGKAFKSVAEEDAFKGKTKATRKAKERVEDLSYENSETSQRDEIKKRATRKSRRNITPPNQYDGAADDYDLPLSDQITVEPPPASTIDSSPRTEVKIAPSQNEPPRMSQIPVGTQIVDLTLSSDPLDPTDDSDDEWVDKHFQRMGMGRSRGRSSSGLKERKSTGSANEKGKAKGKVPGLVAGSKSDLGASAGDGKGIGIRTLLKSKKVRSQQI